MSNYAAMEVDSISVLDRPGAWTAREALGIMRQAAVGRESSQWSAVHRWATRDLHQLPHGRAENPDALYQRVADGGRGEEAFLAGIEGMEAAGYGDLVDVVPALLRRKFLGLGCPWSVLTARPDDVVLDFGCGVGVDLAIASALVGPNGAFGFDMRSPLLPIARAAGLKALQAAVQHVPFRSDTADHVVANGLPPLLRPNTAPPALTEIHRVLKPGGSLTFTTLVSGPDRPISAIDDLSLVNAVRNGKPLCGEYRHLLSRAGFTTIRLASSGSPLRHPDLAGSVRAVVVMATATRRG